METVTSILVHTIIDLKNKLVYKVIYKKLIDLIVFQTNPYSKQEEKRFQTTKKNL